ncbi:hypothetical protein M422DRAFT_170909 [Sphaerobolus stellatus SS14]|uniref:Uncharacterized protein n=1 Tax=Sphaerobolus stellatus (strain SS14) TaxID=990650 RepID=A0A0C9UHW0_SPHS4|nr:hypothetical protein M422DRAFT_170909 [Sphaerobolus stellatus SS14]
MPCVCLGGPGGSAVQFIDRLRENMQDLVGGEYDIVEFDPRDIFPFFNPGSAN